jgi:hypothetical protein
VHDVLLQRTDLCVAGTYGTDGIRSIGWYEFRLRSAMRWRGLMGNSKGIGGGMIFIRATERCGVILFFPYSLLGRGYRCQLPRLIHKSD